MMTRPTSWATGQTKVREGLGFGVAGAGNEGCDRGAFGGGVELVDDPDADRGGEDAGKGDVSQNQGQHEEESGQIQADHQWPLRHAVADDPARQSKDQGRGQRGDHEERAIERRIGAVDDDDQEGIEEGTLGRLAGEPGQPPDAERFIVEQGVPAGRDSLRQPRRGSTCPNAPLAIERWWIGRAPVKGDAPSRELVSPKWWPSYQGSMGAGSALRTQGRVRHSLPRPEAARWPREHPGTDTTPAL